MNKLKITFLGSGSAFCNDVDNFQSNLLLECQGRSLLLDCGTDIRFSMREAGKKLTDVTDLVTLPVEVKRKMRLYHFNQGPPAAAYEEGFKGFVPCRKELFLFSSWHEMITG